MTQLTDKAKHLIWYGAPVGLPDDTDPFEREGGLLYLKFDGIELVNADDNWGGLKVGFSWRGAVMAWIRVEGAFLASGQTLRLNGIEGRQRVDIE